MAHLGEPASPRASELAGGVVSEVGPFGSGSGGAVSRGGRELGGWPESPDLQITHRYYMHIAVRAH